MRNLAQDTILESIVGFVGQLVPFARIVLTVYDSKSDPRRFFAMAGQVSVPTVYAIFKSKTGILTALLDQSMFGPDYDEIAQRELSLKFALGWSHIGSHKKDLI